MSLLSSVKRKSSAVILKLLHSHKLRRVCITSLQDLSINLPNYTLN